MHVLPLGSEPPPIQFNV